MGTRSEKCQEYLKYTFSREEKEEMSDLLARRLKELELAELSKKDIVKNLDADMAKIKTEISGLASKVKDGYEYRSIDCNRTYDFERRMKTTIRLDTFETVRDVPMTAAELQVPLPIDGGGDGSHNS